ncbi:hypothetical protein [Fusobacterium perfoetens]|uniref:hypothetical protein n=1 Tax=Fusobacterium perfoetens TaxID=852 RepID=UPI0026EF6970|nr:hypothetical protein [Fusobacterium perfoetens]
MKKFIIFLILLFHNIIYGEIIYDDGEVKLNLVMNNNGTYTVYNINDNNKPFTGDIKISGKDTDFRYEDFYFLGYVDNKKGSIREKKEYKEMNDYKNLRGVHDHKFRNTAFFKFYESYPHYNGYYRPALGEDPYYDVYFLKINILGDIKSVFLFRDGILELEIMDIISNVDTFNSQWLMIYFYPDGNIQRIRHSCGSLFPLEREYYPNGNKKNVNSVNVRTGELDAFEEYSQMSRFDRSFFSEEDLNDGSTEYYINGKIKKEAKYRNGRAVEEAFFYSPTGKLREKIDVEKGKNTIYKDSDIFYKDSEKEIRLEERGEKIYAINSKDNSLFTGKLVIESNEDKNISKKSEINYKNGLQDGLTKIITETKVKVKHQNTKREVKKTYVFASYTSYKTETEEIMYKNGEKNGKYKKNIDIKTDVETYRDIISIPKNKKADKEKGIETEKIIIEGYYSNDKKEGEFTRYYKRDLTLGSKNYEGDEIKTVTQYKNGMKSGKSITYDFRGYLIKVKNNLPKDEPLIIKEENYILDKLHGTQYYYSKDREKCQHFYILGVELESKEEKNI